MYGETVIKDGKVLVPPSPGAKPGRIRFCRIGAITLELIQPGEGSIRTVNDDFLDKSGGGIGHIAYGIAPEHFAREVEKMKAKGLPIILSGQRADGGGFVYFDTRESGGIIIELLKVQSG